MHSCRILENETQITRANHWLIQTFVGFGITQFAVCMSRNTVCRQKHQKISTFPRLALFNIHILQTNILKQKDLKRKEKKKRKKNKGSYNLFCSRLLCVFAYLYTYKLKTHYGPVTSILLSILVNDWTVWTRNGELVPYETDIPQC